jgi:hypothetical protein
MAQEDFWEMEFGKQDRSDVSCSLEGRRYGPAGFGVIVEVQVRVDRVESGLLQLGFESMGRKRRRDGIGGSRKRLSACHRAIPGGCYTSEGVSAGLEGLWDIASSGSRCHGCHSSHTEILSLRNVTTK